MSGCRSRLITSALLAVLACAVTARADDDFDRRRNERDLAVQKAASDVQAALDTSRTLEKKDAGKAKAVLEQALLRLDDATVLDDRQRTDLRQRLRTRLREVEATVDEQHDAAAVTARREADRAAQAERERQLKKDQGTTPYQQAKNMIDGSKKILDTAAALKLQREKNITDMAVADGKFFAKMNEERFPAYWKELQERRKPFKLTKEEAQLVKTLNSVLSVDFNKESLKGVMNYLDAKTGGLNIFLDANSLKDAGVDYESQVTFKANKVALRVVLKKVFGDLGLTYVIKDGAVQVITPDRIKDYTVVRSYPVGDLLTPVANNQMGPYARRVYAAQQAQQLMALIVSSIDPNTWQVNNQTGGYGTISYDEVTQTLVIRHTAEMHYQLSGAMGR